MWRIDVGEEICCFTDDCIEVGLQAKAASSTDPRGALELAPRFRYLVRVAECSYSTFCEWASKLLLSQNLLIVPRTIQDMTVKAAVVSNLNHRIIRIVGGEDGPIAPEARVEPVRRPAWRTQLECARPARPYLEPRGATTWRTHAMTELRRPEELDLNAAPKAPPLLEPLSCVQASSS